MKKIIKITLSASLLIAGLFLLNTNSNSAGCTEYLIDWEKFSCNKPGRGCIECHDVVQ